MRRQRGHSKTRPLDQSGSLPNDTKATRAKRHLVARRVTYNFLAEVAHRALVIFSYDEVYLTYDITFQWVSALNPRDATGRWAATCGDPAHVLPLYRSYTNTTNTYTTNITLVNSTNSFGYTLQEVAAMIFFTQEESTVPFYRLWYDAAKDSFYTTSTAEMDDAIAAGYVPRPRRTLPDPDLRSRSILSAVQFCREG
ncbi:hypothetical protein MSAN_00490000 [Mycena sanguinolenta]|uniref:DUF5648 domain-containing protein n=1 Tax=Mycena sanguinolenta TaxID=230812 RepID=A0A8H6Z5A1_9AGAR|nr:hypothetical protein MSAN_00490000 [Mycena sanguinolenta]